jgi:hypothetical protein
MRDQEAVPPVMLSQLPLCLGRCLGELLNGKVRDCARWRCGRVGIPLVDWANLQRIQCRTCRLIRFAKCIRLALIAAEARIAIMSE